MKLDASQLSKMVHNVMSYSLDDARQILRGHYASLSNGYVIEETGIPHIPEVYAPES